MSKYKPGDILIRSNDVHRVDPNLLLVTYGVSNDQDYGYVWLTPRGMFEVTPFVRESRYKKVGEIDLGCIFDAITGALNND